MTALIFVTAALFSLQVGLARARPQRYARVAWRRGPIGQTGRPAAR